MYTYILIMCALFDRDIILQKKFIRNKRKKIVSISPHMIHRKEIGIDQTKPKKSL